MAGSKTSKSTLPPSITSQLLRDILHLDPSDWDLIERPILREFADQWTSRSPSDSDFYDKLHEFLQDAGRRARYNAIVRELKPRTSSLALTDRICEYYLSHLRENHPPLAEKMPPRPLPVDILRVFSERTDVEQLVNIAWVFVDDDQIDVGMLAEFDNRHPGFSDLVGLAASASPESPELRWRRAVDVLRKMAKDLLPDVPDPAVATRLRAMSDRALSVAAEFERRQAFLRELDSVVTSLGDVVATSKLGDVWDSIKRAEHHSSFPADLDSVLAEIRSALAAYTDEIREFRSANERIGSAPFHEQRELIDKLSLSYQRQKEALDVVAAAAEQFISSRSHDSDRAKSSSVRRAGIDRSDTDERSDPPTEESSEPDSVVPSEAAADTDATADYEIPGEVATGSGDRVVTRDGPVVERARPDKGGVSPSGESAKDKSEALEGRHEGKANKPYPAPRLKEESRTPSVPDAGERRPKGDAATRDSHKLLYELLASGCFAQAYWVAYASEIIYAGVLGILCEGAFVGPGSVCSGSLSHLLDDLATKSDWNDDERMLVSVGLLQPILFLQPHPESVYQIVDTVVRDSASDSPMSELLKYLRNTCLARGITLTLGTDKSGPDMETRIQQLSESAGDFLDRLPSIRFNYQPAEAALRFIYGPETRWYRLHRLIHQDQRGRIHEIRSLCSNLEPRDEVANAHRSVPGLDKQLVGSARNKLGKHLHDSIALASEWVELVATRSSKGQRGDGGQHGRLESEFRTRLERVRASLGGKAKTAPIEGALRRIDELLGFLERGETDMTSIADAAMDLPNIRLDDEMSPIEEDADLVSAVASLKSGTVDPRDLFAQCLDRDEFVRAKRVVRRHSLGADAEALLERRRDERRRALSGRVDELNSKVEEAFLLGQLWESEDGASPYDRSRLLSLVGDARRKVIEVPDGALDSNVRVVSGLVKQIESHMNTIMCDRKKYLETEKAGVETEFPDTEGGRSDRQYFDTVFAESIERDEHVVAFDLLDRARRAVSRGERIARSESTAPSDALLGFLGKADGYRDGIARYGIGRNITGIRKGDTVHGIHFAQIDTARREEAVEAINAWSRLTRNATPGDIETISEFVGLPVISGGTRRLTAEGQLSHFAVRLHARGPECPLPAFGSMLREERDGENSAAAGGEKVVYRVLDVVVTARQPDAKQISEFLRVAGIGQHAVLVLLVRPASPNYRMNWRKECSRRQTMALPLDSCLLMHLCGERNRLQVLFEVGLPFTWARPYITKGETVAREMFVGRSNEVSDLLDPTGSCIVFGGRQLGKSALLTHVRREYDNIDEGLFIAYFDVNDLGIAPQTPEEMTNVFWQRVSEHLTRAGAIVGPDIAVRRRSRWTEAIPETVLSALQSDSKRRILLLLDETDKMLDVDAGRDFQLVRRLHGLMVNTDHRFKVVLAGLQSVQRYKNRPNQPFAQLGGGMTVEPLAPKAAEELIVRPFRALGFEFENRGLVGRILSLTNYHPGLIQIFCYRLLGNLYDEAQVASTPVRKVTADDILTVERDVSFQEDVRNRFDWTLDLDDRYKVLTYGLVLSSASAVSKTVSEFKELGNYWWKQVFNRMDKQAMGAVLEEMVGLGVLAPERSELVRRYRLRSPNLLRLLGP